MLAIVGLYMNPPQNAVVLSVDEKTSIQALDRTQPRLPVKPHKIERLSHEYKRNGTASCWPAWMSIADKSAASAFSATTASPSSAFCGASARLPRPGPLRRGR